MKNKKYIIISLSILFVILSILVMLDLTVGIDDFVYNLITFKQNNIITNIYKSITFLGSTTFIILLCIVFLIMFIILKKKNTGIIISVVLIISTIVNNILKIIFRRSRPEVLALVVEDSFSFPSGHTMASVSMYGILIYIILKSNLNKKLKIILSIILGLLPLLVGLSRVYLGAHFITDIIGAFIISSILLLIEINIIDKKNLM